MPTGDASQRLRIALDDDGSSVSALLLAPPDARAAYVFAHGAGAGMEHAFMTAFATGLAERSIATLRYQFPYMEQGSKLPGLPLLAGGKSFGGRMTSQAQAASPMPGVAGLVFVGFPLHPAGKPSDERARHLLDVGLPMLFLQGTRDELADLALLQPVVGRLGARATLELFDDADHAFHVRARSGSNDAQVMGAMLDAVRAWVNGVLPQQS
jgi:predicted alpha/beta-hydrolase family hydrolase